MTTSTTNKRLDLGWFRYVVWTSHGKCQLFSIRPLTFDFDRGAWGYHIGLLRWLPELDNKCPLNHPSEKVFDLRDNTGRMVIEALMEF